MRSFMARHYRRKRLPKKADSLKSRLLANISHELRNPLHIILSCAGKIDIPTASYGESQQIQKQALHLMRLINDLLDLSRAEIGELSINTEVVEPVGFLTDVFESVADNLRGDSQVYWHLDLPDYLPLIQADPDRLRQVLLNLLSNARKFTRDGRVELGAEVAAPYLHIWVEDTGSGIPVDQQEEIFEPFVTYSESGRRNEGWAWDCRSRGAWSHCITA